MPEPQEKPVLLETHANMSNIRQKRNPRETAAELEEHKSPQGLKGGEEFPQGGEKLADLGREQSRETELIL